MDAPETLEKDNAVDSDQPNHLDALAEEFVAQLRNGNQPSICQYIERYPELADDIRSIFPTLALMESIGKDVSSKETGERNVPPIERLGEYRIIREIGRGGMGVVYEAEHCSMRRRVALKILPADMALSANHLHRFQREARAAGKLHHTNLVPVFEVGEQDGIHYYAMQYIHGKSLDQVIAELRRLASNLSGTAAGKTEVAGRTAQLTSDAEFNKRPADDSRSTAETAGSKGRQRELDPADLGKLFQEAASLEQPALTDLPQSKARQRGYFQRVAQIGIQLADALGYAHGLGVLHRDIKPANLILDTTGIIWITDFGLARHDEDDLTRTGEIIGTLRYLAPERLNGQADARSDIYALGLILYELCTLQPAFGESDPVKLIRQITNFNPVGPRKLNGRIPRDLETIILKSIDKEPGNRFQSADEMANDLRLFDADRPLLSRRSDFAERTWRWCRRNPVIASLTALVALLLGIVFCGSLWFGITSGRYAAELRARTVQAQKSEQRTLLALYEARRSQAMAARNSGLRGQREDGLRAVHDAVEILPRLQGLLEHNGDELFPLRNDAIASLAHPDLKITRSWTTSGPWTTEVDFDADYRIYAHSSLSGEIVVRRTSDDQLVARFPSPGHRAWALRLSPDGKYLAARYHPPREGVRQVSVWNVETQQEVTCDKGPFWFGRYAFSPDSRTFAVGRRDRTIQFYDLPEGRPHEDRLPVKSHPMDLSFEPSGRRLAVSDGDQHQIELVDLIDGTTEVVSTDCFVHSLYWTDDGSTLAGGGEDGNIYFWNSQRTADPPRKIAGHTAGVVNVVFNHRGDRLASYAWDGSSRLWDLQSNRQLVRANATRIVGNHFSPDDTRLVFATRDKFGIWEVLDRGPLSVLASTARIRTGVSFVNDSTSLILSATSEGIEVRDSDESSLLFVLPSGSSTMARSSPDGSAIISSGENGLQRWPVSRKDRHWKAGEPETLDVTPTQHFDMDADGRWLIALQNDSIVSIDLRNPSNDAVVIDTHQLAQQVAISPNGQWIVTTASHMGSGIRVWDRASARLVNDLGFNSGTAMAAFSPDGKWLVASTLSHFFVWEVGTWTLRYQLDRGPLEDWVGSICFSSDSRIFACTVNRRSIHLVETLTGKSLAILESSDPGIVGSMQFNADDTQLAVVVESGLQIWSLDQLQQELGEVGLDW